MEHPTADLARWAESGAMALCGPADGPPLVGPAGLAGVMVAAAGDLADQTARWGRRVVVDGPALLGERAAITGMTRNGSVSVGGSARFLRASDGWFALNLPRPDDVAALPALVSRDVGADDWAAIEAALAAMTVEQVVDQAVLLGLAVGAPTPRPRPAAPVRELARGGGRTPRGEPLVVDLSSLWAGPLAASLLRAAGARVIKVESTRRPDGARRGATAFYDLLNHGKECLALDFDDAADRALLARVVGAADLVIEGSRARAMDALGLDPVEVAAHGTNWISVTAHGRTGPEAHRVGFGDDAAVAGGLCIPGDPPMFVADAVADPIAGLVAAVHGADLLAADRAAVVDVALARVAAWAGGPVDDTAARAHDGGWVVGDGTITVAPPRHRAIPPRAAAAGEHSAALRAEFALPADAPG